MKRMIVLSFSEMDHDWFLDSFKWEADDIQRDQALIGDLEPSTLPLGFMKEKS